MKIRARTTAERLVSLILYNSSFVPFWNRVASLSLNRFGSRLMFEGVAVGLKTNSPHCRASQVHRWRRDWGRARPQINYIYDIYDAVQKLGTQFSAPSVASIIPLSVGRRMC